MPRNSSGTYSLYTPGNPVVPSTVITTTWANNTLSDIATALTASLSRSGDGGMLAPLQLAAGAVGAPGMSWTAETTSGWYRAGAGDFRYSVGGVDKFTITTSLVSTAGNFTVGGGALIGAATGGNQGTGTINATGVYDDGVLLANQAGANPSATIGLAAVNGSAGTFLRSDGAPALSQAIAPTWSGQHQFSLAVWHANGSAGTPSITFTGDTDTGLFWSSANRMAFACNGQNVASIDDTRFGLGIPIWAADGTAGTPGMGFLNDTDTGIYRIGTNSIGFSEGGTGFQIGYRSIPRSTTATTLAIGDLAKCVAVSAAIAIPASVFSAGDAISVYNDSAGSVNITIAAGTLRLAGTTTTGTRALAPRGLATLWFNVGGATPEVVASGQGLS